MTYSPSTKEIKTFALKVFSLVVHSRGVESLFSIMGYFKSKNRNRMEIKTLEMLAQLKLFLLEDPEYLEYKELIKIKQSASTLNQSRAQTSNLDDSSEIEVMQIFDSVLMGEAVINNFIIMKLKLIFI